MRVPFHRPRVGAPEVRAVTRALRAGRIRGGGEVSARVERRLSERTGAPAALLAASEAQALAIALDVARIGAGDEVIVPALGGVERAAVLVARGARPVIAAIDPDALSLDVADAARRVTPRTRAILPAHHAGVACDLEGVLALAREHRLLVIEDAAEALGASFRGRALGTHGDLGLIGFGATRNVTAGEGAALLVRDPALADLAAASPGRGISDLCAALLDAQLDRLDAITAARRATWERYHAELWELERAGRLRRPRVPAGAEHNAHAYAVLARDAAERDAWARGLAARGIETRAADAAPALYLPLDDRVRRRHVEIVVRALRAVAR